MSENIENDKIVEENSMIGVVEQLKDENMLAYYIWISNACIGNNYY